MKKHVAFLPLFLSSFAYAQSGKTLAVGPIAAFSLPYEYVGGIQARFRDVIAADAVYGYYKFSGDTQVIVQEPQLRLKWFPWRGNFFMGLTGGYLMVAGKRASSISGTLDDVPTVFPYTIKLTINAITATPHIGYDFTWKSGFLVGFDVGATFSFAPKSKATATFSDEFKELQDQLEATRDYVKAKKDSEDTMNTFIKTTRLNITALRVGWLF